MMLLLLLRRRQMRGHDGFGAQVEVCDLTLYPESLTDLKKNTWRPELTVRFCHFDPIEREKTNGLRELTVNYLLLSSPLIQ